jgi:hypothetical protein
MEIERKKRGFGLQRREPQIRGEFFAGLDFEKSLRGRMDEDADARRWMRGNWWLFLRDVESWHMQKRCIFAVLQCALQTPTVFSALGMPP